MADTFNTALSNADDAILEGLGETVTVKDTLDAAVGSVVGVFENQYVEVSNVQGVHPTFTYKASDLTIATGYEITREGIAYNVRYPQPDGTGMVMLILGDKS